MDRESCGHKTAERCVCVRKATLRRNTNPDPRLDPEAAKKKLGDLQLGVGSKAIFVGRSHFGCVATIIPDASRGLSKQVLIHQMHMPWYSCLPASPECDFLMCAGLLDMLAKASLCLCRGSSWRWLELQAC